MQDYAITIQPFGPGSQPSGMSLQSRVSELEAEVSQLREQLGKAKGINDTMWETVVQKMVAESREMAKESEMNVDNAVSERRTRRQS